MGQDNEDIFNNLKSFIKVTVNLRGYLSENLSHARYF